MFIEIKGHPHYYISQEGVVKREKFCEIKKNGVMMTYCEKILTATDNGNGYMQVAIRGKQCYIHRLVAKAFLPNEFEKSQVNHKDGDKSNNCLRNLEWVTPSENEVHKIYTLKKKSVILSGLSGIHNGNSKIDSLKKIEDIFSLRNDLANIQDIADKFCVSTDTISRILNKKTHKDLSMHLHLAVKKVYNEEAKNKLSSLASVRMVGNSFSKKKSEGDLDY